MGTGQFVSRRAAVVVVAGTALLGVGLVVLGFRSAGSPPEPGTVVDVGEPSSPLVHPPVPDEAEPSRRHQGVEDLITGPVLPHADPLSVAIPRLHVASPLVQLGIDDLGAMEVPDDPADAGWYRLGPPPGSLGPAVIAGHVTWNQVPAVFFRLSEVRPGDLVEVTRADGRLAVFEVTAVRLFEKTEFPTRVIFGPVDHAALRLITCGGEYEESAHRYLGNVVVFARLASSRGTGQVGR